MLNRRELIRLGTGLAAAAAVPWLTAEKQRPDSKITGSNSLKAHAKARGLLAGCAVSTAELRGDAAFRQVVQQQYDIVVPENCMKWKTLRPTPDTFAFEEGDELIAFAEKNKMKVRGHNLVWHEALPDWFATTVTKENASHFLTDHILKVGGHFQGRIHSWDVVNEAILPKDGREDGLRKSPWMELLGPDYIDIAFRTARQADPKALLTYNDYGIEYDDEESDLRRKSMLTLLRGMQARKVPLDAVGIQSHIKAAQTKTIGNGLCEFMASIREMKLQIFLTEMDVNEDDIASNDIAERDRQIAATYLNYLTVALAEPAVKAVLTWGVSDKHTWLNNGPTHEKKQPDRPQRSLPFDSNYQPAPAFFAMRKAFDAAPKR